MGWHVPEATKGVVATATTPLRSSGRATQLVEPVSSRLSPPFTPRGRALIPS